MHLTGLSAKKLPVSNKIINLAAQLFTARLNPTINAPIMSQMKILLYIAALALICQTSKADDFVVDNITYTTLTDATVAVAASSAGKYAGSLQIPPSVNYEDNSYTVTEISARAFYTCNQLTNVTFPSTITAIGEYAFSGCTSLNDVTLPNGITTIENGTFYGCWSLTDITIPATVTSIGEKAFFNCLRLNAVTLPEGITIIGEYAFDHCTKLTDITLPKTLRVLRGHAFDNCTSLSSITIPENVYQIDTDPFAACTALTHIDVSPNNTRFASIDGVLLDAKGKRLVCYPCGKTGEYVMPETVTTIDDQAFCNRTQLTAITLSPALTIVGSQTFYGCSEITEIRFPATMLEIGVRAMREMTALKSIYCYAKNPPTIYNTTFGTGTCNTVPLYVPKRVVEKYENGDYWWRFANILPIDEYLDIHNVVAFAGTRTKLNIDLSVAEPITAIEFDLFLPNGMTPASGGNNVALSSRLGGVDADVSVTPAGEGCWHVTCQCPETAQIAEMEGPLMALTFDVDDSQEDFYDCFAANVTVTYTDGMTEEIGGCDFEVEVIMGIMGDADNSGDVSVTDVMLTVEHVLGNMPQNFHFPLADIDQNDEISITDVLEIVSIILNN